MSSISLTTRRWMSPPPIYETHNIVREGTTLTPYLTLPYILSLTWLAYPIISLLFVAFRLAISSSSAQDSVEDAKANLLASCAAAEKAATVAASLPRYMAIGTNKQIASAVNGTMNAARATLVLSLTIMEAIINFVIDIYRSTFFCFLELVVRGGLAAIIDAVQEINDFLSSTFSSIRTSIQNDITSINSAVQSAVDGINKVNPFGNISAPQFDVPDLSVLDNVTLPDSVQSSLTNLNSSLPTLDQLRDSIKDFVDTPFEDLKADINTTFAGLDFNAQTLAVPDQETLSFCQDMDTSIVDDLGRDLVKITKIGIVILVILALLLIAAHCALEWYKWRCLQQHLEYTRQAWVTDPTMNNNNVGVQNGEAPSMRMTDHNLLILAGSQQHPLLTRISNQLAALLHLTPSQHTNLQWFFHYVFHPPVLAVFLIGFLGLLSVQIQLLAIHPIEEKYSAQVASSVSDFSNTIATSMNASMYNQSAAYADQINTQVNTTQSTINDGLFGWVNGTTTTLNDTLVNFYADIQNAVSTVFNGTVLEDPIQEFVRCIIGTKIEAIENALTFLNENLIIDIPRMNESALVLSQADVDEASKPIAAAAVGDGSDGNEGLVGKLVARYVASLEKERLMFAIFIALWGLVVLIALLIIFWHSYVKPKIDARKQKKLHGGRRELASFITPYSSETVPAYSNAATGPVEKSRDVDEKTPRPEVFFDVKLRSPTARRGGSEYPADHQHQRSWDSFLDSSAVENGDNKAKDSPPRHPSSQTKLKISGPRKLTAIGSKAGKERFISDEERARMRDAAAASDANSDEDEAKESSWLQRLTNAFRSKSSLEHLDAQSSNSTQSSATDKPRKRPNLTIRTSLSNAAFVNISRDRLPTAGGAPPQGAGYVQNNPPSAWSVSPQPPRTLPWLPNPANTAGKRPKAKTAKTKTGVSGLPSSPRAVVGQSSNNRAGGLLSPFVPGNGGNVNGGNATGTFPMPGAPAPAVTVTPAAQTQTQTQTPFSGKSMQSGVPSYYHSSLPHYTSARHESLLPENTLSVHRSSAGKHNHYHKRTSSMPLTQFTPTMTGTRVGGSAMRRDTDGKATTTPTHASTRHASVAAGDPFRTPFDDDARVRSRHASIAAGDPFRTPFDDDARVIPENWPQPPPTADLRAATTSPTTATPSPGVNPFWPKAI